MRHARVGATLALALLAGASACWGNGGSTSGRIQVVAGENFYGDMARQLGGRYVDVTSILTDPDADPHLFEPGTHVAAQMAAGRLVIVNGLDYDGFMDRILKAAPDPDRKVVTVAQALGISGKDANPHIWYDEPRLDDIAGAITGGLIDVDPAHRPYFQQQLARFRSSLAPLHQAVAAIRSKDGGAPVAYTEPVPGYLLDAAGLVIRTPPGFALAIEEGNDPTVQEVAEFEALISGHQIRVLLLNSQATSPITERLRKDAEREGIPVVLVTETLPPGKTFQAWQLGQVRDLQKALEGP